MVQATISELRRFLRPVKRAWSSTSRLLFGEFNDYLSKCRGLIHVGAHRGQERGDYNRNGLTVIWIEPIPELYHELVKNLREFPKQTAINALITDEDGEEKTLHVSNNDGASSSIFDLNMHRDIWADVSFVRDVHIKSETLPTALARTGQKPSDFDALVLDAQGAELLVLRGAEPILAGFRYIQTEAADFESYSGGTTIAELTAYLNRFKFKLVRTNVFMKHPNGGRYCDLLFEKVS